ncbi:BPK_HP2_G0000660.mRNA.1.CDS.1 [Saccharomyces cerevisiae]|uniref:YAL008Wp-like protein n=1 Tax=Saccharomyces cerevisiae (strain AWRI1631) TaxID=545124 RepID=B5VDL5_YEAS6|nr:Fun14p [Saccharomyces cerevisiae YJM189]AJO93771.1 Fun14p [Saccharomyces cerevisiae YJM682]AJO93827.1 Fun14p [Saccharomyces cerevisiae YJM683]AJO94787.1 Fun14p [Saccharomyces cerevisiae YJM1129]AJO95284.1 Fun14p [Saccharomyces cerevisiae YJM1244]AJO95652.1 Fun14p [Saccharomyces cerevisiae YJM1304]AJO98367.1 Fun14p [Saccharomyces cerevisiae YJM1526]AJP36966.1 Fun14p [Saccharomyces cerevisiae YJM1078]EDZ73983.1 YAL008Wp-like protein [Saccharomyces cerevisiae AWRI1631]EWG87915.1 Fun14p [Sa
MTLAFNMQRLVFRNLNVGKRMFKNVPLWRFNVANKLGKPLTRSVGLGGAGIVAAGFYLMNRQPSKLIFNDSLGAAVKQEGPLEPNVGNSTAITEERRNKISSHKQMFLGSLFGVVLGVTVAKISILFMYVGITSMLLCEWLRYKGWIRINLKNIKSVIVLKDVDLKKLLIDGLLGTEYMGFKVFFTLSFVLASLNANK